MRLKLIRAKWKTINYFIAQNIFIRRYISSYVNLYIIQFSFIIANQVTKLIILRWTIFNLQFHYYFLLFSFSLFNFFFLCSLTVKSCLFTPFELCGHCGKHQNKELVFIGHIVFRTFPHRPFIFIAQSINEIN